MNYRLFIFILALVLVMPSQTEAILELEAEEEIADLLPNTFPGLFAKDKFADRAWGVLPQVGYGPETGIVSGIKGIHRNIGNRGIVADIDTTCAEQKQQAYTFSLALTDLANDHLIVLLRLRYRLDPAREFFGIGNNDIDSADITDYGYEDMTGALTIGWRPFRRVAFNFGLGVRHLDTWCDQDEAMRACTIEEFPYFLNQKGTFSR